MSIDANRYRNPEDLQHIFVDRAEHWRRFFAEYDIPADRLMLPECELLLAAKHASERSNDSAQPCGNGSRGYPGHSKKHYKIGTANT